MTSFLTNFHLQKKIRELNTVAGWLTGSCHFNYTAHRRLRISTSAAHHFINIPRQEEETNTTKKFWDRRKYKKQLDDFYDLIYSPLEERISILFLHMCDFFFLLLCLFVISHLRETFFYSLFLFSLHPWLPDRSFNTMVPSCSWAAKDF